jgi:hypothetical protein
MSEPTNILWYSAVAIKLLFCVYLVWTRVAKKHRVFTLYLACSVLRSLIAVQFPVMAHGGLPESYTYFWLWTEPALLLLQIGVALEVHAALWKDYQTVARSARPLLLFSLLTALLFAALPVTAELRLDSGIRLEAVMRFEFLATRYLSTVLAVFLVLSALLFLLSVRSSLKSSLFQNESMLAAYFGIYAIAYLIVNTGWKRAIFVNNYMLSALTLCLVIWISVFRPHRDLLGIEVRGGA